MGEQPDQPKKTAQAKKSSQQHRAEKSESKLKKLAGLDKKKADGK